MTHDRENTDIFMRSRKSKKGNTYFQGIDDHKNFFLVVDNIKSHKNGFKTWKLVIKSPQLDV